MIRGDRLQALGLDDSDDLLTRAEASAFLTALGLPMRPGCGRRAPRGHLAGM